MKRLITIAITILLSTIIMFSKKVYAQSESAYSDGDIVTQAGIGFGMRGSYGDTKVPPITLSADYAKQINKDLPLSFGGFFGYAKSEDETSITIPFPTQTYKWSYEYTYYMFGIRAAYHFTPLLKKEKNIENLDVYAGAMLGYAVVSVSTEEPSGAPSAYSSDAESSYLLWGIYAGARYYFTENLGAFAELGLGTSYLTGGICYKF